MQRGYVCDRRRRSRLAVYRCVYDDAAATDSVLHAARARSAPGGACVLPAYRSGETPYNAPPPPPPPPHRSCRNVCTGVCGRLACLSPVPAAAAELILGVHPIPHRAPLPHLTPHAYRNSVFITSSSLLRTAVWSTPPIGSARGLETQRNHPFRAFRLIRREHGTGNIENGHGPLAGQTRGAISVVHPPTSIGRVTRRVP